MRAQPKRGRKRAVVADSCWILCLDTALGCAAATFQPLQPTHFQDGNAEAESFVHGIIELEADRAVGPAQTIQRCSTPGTSPGRLGVPAEQRWIAYPLLVVLLLKVPASWNAIRRRFPAAVGDIAARSAALAADVGSTCVVH